jgi:hypothetical protein
MSRSSAVTRVESQTESKVATTTSAVIGPSHIRRIEGGIVAYRADMWLDTNPAVVEMPFIDPKQGDPQQRLATEHRLTRPAALAGSGARARS